MEKIKSKGFFAQILKGVLLTLLSMLLGIFVFAIIVNLCSLTNSVIKPVNQFIKIVSVFIGCLFSVKEKKGLIKGSLIGLLSTLLIYLIFAMFCGTKLGLSFLIDCLILTVSGGIFGVIIMSLRKD